MSRIAQIIRKLEELHKESSNDLDFGKVAGMSPHTMGFFMGVLCGVARAMQILEREKEAEQE